MGRHPFAHSMRWVSGVGNGCPDLHVREAQIQNFPQKPNSSAKSLPWRGPRGLGSHFLGILALFMVAVVQNFANLASR